MNITTVTTVARTDTTVILEARPSAPAPRFRCAVCGDAVPARDRRDHLGDHSPAALAFDEDGVRACFEAAAADLETIACRAVERDLARHDLSWSAIAVAAEAPRQPVFRFAVRLRPSTEETA